MKCYCVSFISKTFITDFAQSENQRAGFRTVRGEAFSFHDGAWEAAEGKVKGTWTGSPRVVSTGASLPYLFYPKAGCL